MDSENKSHPLPQVFLLFWLDFFDLLFWLDFFDLLFWLDFFDLLFWLLIILTCDYLSFFMCKCHFLLMLTVRMQKFFPLRTFLIEKNTYIYLDCKIIPVNGLEPKELWGN